MMQADDEDDLFGDINKNSVEAEMLSLTEKENN
jgi:hypothetical protein